MRSAAHPTRGTARTLANFFGHTARPRAFPARPATVAPPNAATVQVQLGPPSRTAFPLRETRSCHHSVSHFVPNTCPMTASNRYG